MTTSLQFPCMNLDNPFFKNVTLQLQMWLWFETCSQQFSDNVIVLAMIFSLSSASSNWMWRCWQMFMRPVHYCMTQWIFSLEPLQMLDDWQPVILSISSWLHVCKSLNFWLWFLWPLFESCPKNISHFFLVYSDSVQLAFLKYFPFAWPSFQNFSPGSNGVGSVTNVSVSKESDERSGLSIPKRNSSFKLLKTTQ